MGLVERHDRLTCACPSGAVMGGMVKSILGPIDDALKREKDAGARCKRWRRYVSPRARPSPGTNTMLLRDAMAMAMATRGHNAPGGPISC
jgi:hypothetical protein